jgi:1-acyl-sn-glycerol-3-phosphate acyltransferase
MPGMALLIQNHSIAIRVFYTFEQMIRLLRQLHRGYYLLILLLVSIVLYPFVYLAASKQKWYGHLNRIRILHSRLCSFLSGFSYNFVFESPLQHDQTYIYCANHTSQLDIMIMCMLAKRRFHFMGKEELLNHPILKMFFRTIDIPVNRDSRISAFRAFKKAAENLNAGMSLIIFPEGGISDAHYPPRLAEFKNGPFRLAIENNIPIVPVTITNAWKLMFDDGRIRGSRPGRCDIYIHKPIFTQDLAPGDDAMLKDQVYKLVESKLL